jgi:putative PIN family toxin of toxin-antitoxin system
MSRPILVLDTNVFVAALRSRRGASFELLSQVGTGRFDIVVSVALVLEYEATAQRHLAESGLDAADLDAILDYLCAVADRRKIFYLWRPTLRDPGDDLVLEVAVSGNAEFIVTFNERDFEGAERFGVRVLRPGPFLNWLEKS